MIALGLGVVALILLTALLRSAIAIGAAYALTTLVALPGWADTLTWVVAGGFTLLQIIGAVIGIGALAIAGKTQKRLL